jgi:hypothetical protein
VPSERPRRGGVDVNAESDADMTKGKFIVFNEPDSTEVDAEYNAWYADTHLPQLLESCPSITAATRFKLVSGQENPLPGTPNYMAIYDIEADDLMTARAEMASAVQAGKVIMSDTIRSDPPSTYLIYEQI